MQASEITHYLIQVSEDVAPLKSVSTHLKIATYDLIPGKKRKKIKVYSKIRTRFIPSHTLEPKHSATTVVAAGSRYFNYFIDKPYTTHPLPH